MKKSSQSVLQTNCSRVGPDLTSQKGISISAPVVMVEMDSESFLLACLYAYVLVSLARACVPTARVWSRFAFLFKMIWKFVLQQTDNKNKNRHLESQNQITIELLTLNKYDLKLEVLSYRPRIFGSSNMNSVPGSGPGAES